MLAYTALLSLAALVAADQTFSLTAQGDNINSQVGIEGSNLVLGGTAASFDLQEPSGYLTANGQNVVLTPNGIQVSDSNQSKDFGVEDGKLRTGPSIDKFDFYSCPDGTLANFQCTNGVAITLYTNGAPAQSSAAESAAPSTSTASSSSTEVSKISSSSEAAKSSVTGAPAVESSIVTDVHSTLVTVTSCADHACNKTSASVTSYEGGAAQAGFAAGALAIAGAMLL